MPHKRETNIETFLEMVIANLSTEHDPFLNKNETEMVKQLKNKGLDAYRVAEKIKTLRNKVKIKANDI